MGRGRLRRGLAPLLFAAALLTGPGNALPAAAQPARRATSGPSDQQIQRWREQLLDARKKLEAARKRSDAAQAAYRNLRQRRYPRGEARQEILAELQESSVALEEARAALPRLREEARRAGAPPGLLRGFAADVDR